MNHLPDVELLRNELSYNPLTGEFRWLYCKQGRNADLSVDCTLREGYRKFCIDGKTYQAHRVAFLMFHGREPFGQIDHINGQRTDNRICNLREATPTENMRNKESVGFSRHPKRIKNPFQVRIKVGEKHVHVGVFPTEEKAAEAYRAARQKYFGKFDGSMRRALGYMDRT